MKQFIVIIIFSSMSIPAISQDWVDRDLYPFKHKYFDLESGKLHYVDEGEGEVILFIHGTPTWSFLYRDFIKELSKTHRCIAIDHMGFGLSDKPDSVSGTPEWHSENLTLFIRSLNLRKITMVVHDFGGPIGLGSAIENSDRVDRIVLFNSWLWETENEPQVEKIDKTINSWLGRFLYLHMNISPKVLLKKGFYDKSELTKKVHQQYIAPFPNKESRIPLLNLAKSLKGSSAWYQSQWEKLLPLEEKDWLILWGTEDEFITPEYLKKWKKRLPQAKVKEFNCGHFVQEEKTAEAIRSIKDFVSK